MRTLIIWFSLTFFFLIHFTALSQTISGTISDKNNSTIPGVSIYVEGTTIGTTSDIDGYYSLIVISGDVIGDSLTIVYSFVGFKPQHKRIANNPAANYSFDITLREEIEMLEEFVVVGYGVQKKSDVTGAISSIKMNEINNLPVTRIDQALQGKAAGVQVSQTSGAPGAGIKVRIRGIGTINNNDPLYIVDGIPTKDIAGILNPEDIESITVLKDAASAAIYGARAGNGVIIIKTKKGKQGKTSLSYNFYSGFQTHGALTPMTNTNEYLEIFNEAAAADGRDPIPDEIVPQLSDTDWMKEIFQTAIMQSHQLSLSGGDDKTTYLISGGYQQQDGIIHNSSYDRVNLRTSITTYLTDWLNLGVNVTSSWSSRDIIGASGDGYGGNGGSVVRYAFFRTPPVPVYEPNGEFSDLPQFDGYSRAQLNTWFGDGYNPVGLAKKYDWSDKNFRTFGNLFADVRLMEGLNFRTDFGIDLSTGTEKRFNENWGTDGRINSLNSMYVATDLDFTYTWTNTLNYKKTFNEKHITSFLLGTEVIKNSYHAHIGNDRDFPDQSPNYRYLGNGLALNKSVSEVEDGWALLSLFSRVNYNYNNRFLVEAVIRTDGSSRFAPGKRWGAFYSGSIGWNMHHEKFLKDVSWLSQMKLRASIGQTGNQEIPLFNYLSIIEDEYNYPIGGVMNIGYAVASFGDENTTWETTTTYDLGLDLAFFDDRLSLITDYYWRYTTDMLIPVPFPPSGGSAAPPFVNAGEVLNRGLEVELFWQDKKNKFKYQIGGNIATLYNEVLSLSNGRPISAGRIDNGVYATLTEEGYSIGSFYLYEMEGIFQNELDIFTHAYQGSNIQPGDVKFKDQNGDNIIDEKDKTHVGSPIPNLMYGLTMNFNRGAWDLSIFFQGVMGNEYYMQVNHDIEGFYRGFNVTKRYYDNRWTGEGTSDEYPRASWKATTNNKKPSTRFLEPASYFRFKNISLGYSFAFGENAGINALRVYVSAQNLFTITNYPGLDPEMYDSDNLKTEKRSPDLAAGIDWGTYPMPRIYTFGINIEL